MFALHAPWDLGLRGLHKLGLGDAGNSFYYVNGQAEPCTYGDPSVPNCLPPPDNSGVAQAQANLANYTPVPFATPAPFTGVITNPSALTDNGANPYAGPPVAVVNNADGTQSIVDAQGNTVYSGAAVAKNPALLGQVPTESGLISTWTMGGDTLQNPNAYDPSCNGDTGVCGSYYIAGAVQPVNDGWWLNAAGVWIWTGPGAQPSVNPDQALAVNQGYVPTPITSPTTANQPIANQPVTPTPTTTNSNTSSNAQNGGNPTPVGPIDNPVQPSSDVWPFVDYSAGVPTAGGSSPVVTAPVVTASACTGGFMDLFTSGCPNPLTTTEEILLGVGVLAVVVVGFMMMGSGSKGRR